MFKKYLNSDEKKIYEFFYFFKLPTFKKIIIHFFFDLKSSEEIRPDVPTVTLFDGLVLGKYKE